LDPSHSQVGFTARHAMVTRVRGAFTDVAGTLTVDGDQPNRSQVDVTIEAASVDTRSEDRDAHLRSGDFFDTDTYPTITFTSTDIEQHSDVEFRVTGDLKIRDTSRPVTLDLSLTGVATDPFGNERIGFEGAVEVNRRDWNLTWNAALEAGGVLVSEKVTLEFDVSAIRSA
ncbi:MAG: YceI family protein, partial [Nitriliruptoraceae bacterium]